jgi:hypothetical protein
MKRAFFLVAVCLASLARPALAQVEGFHLEAGVVFLTHSGSFTFGPSEVETDAGYAFRARARYGFGWVSLAGEFQETSQSYGMPPSPAAPQNLDTSFLGGTVAIHPFKFAGIVPYGEIGLGKLFFGDQSISTSQGSTASVYGLGVGIGVGGKLGIDIGLRLVKLGNLTATGIAQSFDYDPKELGILLSLKL